MCSAISNLSVPRSDIDLFSPAALANPYPYYSLLREIGSAVYLERLDAWALTRHDAVRKALADWRTFSSTDGVSLNEATNAATSSSPLSADPPRHSTPRRILTEHLSPMAVRAKASAITEIAESACEQVVAQGAFDAVFDLARPYFMSAIGDHLGLSAELSTHLIECAEASFDVMGPEGERTRGARIRMGELGVALLRATSRENLSTNAAGQAIYEAGDSGKITPAQAGQLAAIYLLASLPTSAAALSSAVWLLAHHPLQWEALRETPELVPAAVDEVLRLESPIKFFTRVLRAPYELDGVSLPAGARVLLLFGSANRDERVWERASAFDITRQGDADHLAFGHGLHSCSGQGLARMQLAAMLTALTRRVTKWTAGEARWKPNNVLRGLDSFPVAVNGRGRPAPPSVPSEPRISPATQITDWRVIGAIHIAKLGQSVALPPEARFRGAFNMTDGKMDGAMELPRATSLVKVLGIAVGTTSQMIPEGGFDGDVSINPDGTISMRATSRARMHIQALHVGRLRIPLNCRTVTPIEMPLESSGTMSLDFRPSFSGTMTIPRFRGSGPIGPLLSRLVSGPGNSFEIALRLESDPLEETTGAA